MLDIETIIKYLDEQAALWYDNHTEKHPQEYTKEFCKGVQQGLINSIIVLKTELIKNES